MPSISMQILEALINAIVDILEHDDYGMGIKDILNTFYDQGWVLHSPDNGQGYILIKDGTFLHVSTPWEGEYFHAPLWSACTAKSRLKLTLA